MRLFNRGAFLIGLVVIALGVVMLLKNFGILSISVDNLITTYWPLLLVIWGMDVIFPGAGAAAAKARRSSGRLAAGLVLIALGLLLIGHNLELFELDFSFFW
jgi:predicted Na+-dependent transporter